VGRLDEGNLEALRPEPLQGTRERARAAARPGRLARLRSHFSIRRIAIFLVMATLVPIVLGLLFRIEAIRPASTLMVGRWLTFQAVDRNWVDIKDISPALVRSVLMSEDGKFCFHHGIDLKELNNVIDDALEGEKTRGASTITMQTAKNLFLWNGRSFVRKAAELPLAAYLDLVLPKQRILEIYLNIAEWGDGIFGVEAAAQRYFKRSASKLSARQAALLAVTLPAPGTRNPAKPGPGLQRLAGVIERRAARAGGYTDCIQ
jgi:monofunctional biosynthetic peptidoglycan transglycosylase